MSEFGNTSSSADFAPSDSDNVIDVTQKVTNAVPVVGALLKSGADTMKKLSATTKTLAEKVAMQKTGVLSAADQQLLQTATTAIQQTISTCLALYNKETDATKRQAIADTCRQNLLNFFTALSQQNAKVWNVLSNWLIQTFAQTKPSPPSEESNAGLYWGLGIGAVLLIVLAWLGISASNKNKKSKSAAEAA